MARISLWNYGKKSKDYQFVDRTVSEFINSSGTALYLYLYEGVYLEDGSVSGITQIQDVVLQENRDRKYRDEIIEMRGTYNVQDNDFDLRQFGFFMSNDTVFIEVHINDMLALCGRKIIQGDVIELPHMRDDALLDEGDAINRFYVVEDASRASDGYSQTWFPHLWRLKISPMTASQEFEDILKRVNKDAFGLETGGTIGDIVSIVGATLDLNQAVIDEAKIYVKARNFETRQFYFIPGEELGDQLPWIWAGDGIPPNGATLLGSGQSFPINAVDGDYFLKTNVSPHQLYKKNGSSWKLQELDYRRGKWDATHRLYADFINERGQTLMDDGRLVDTKIALSKAVRPDPDFE